MKKIVTKFRKRLSGAHVNTTTDKNTNQRSDLYYDGVQPNTGWLSSREGARTGIPSRVCLGMCAFRP